MATKKQTGRGRPNAYETIIKPHMEDIILWARSGSTNAEIASALGIAQSTFQDHLSKNKDFSESLKEARLSGVPLVKQALLKKCLGYEYEEVKTSIRQDGEGEKTFTEITRKYQAPDTAAIQVYLRNYGDPEGFHDKDVWSMKLKERELELREKIAEQNNW